MRKRALLLTNPQIEFLWTMLDEYLGAVSPDRDNRHHVQMAGYIRDELDEIREIREGRPGKRDKA